LKQDKCYFAVEILKCDRYLSKLDIGHYHPEIYHIIYFGSIDCFFKSGHYSCFTNLYVDIESNLKYHLHLFSIVQDPTELCLKVKLMFFRNILRKNDFLALMKSIQRVPSLENEIALLLIFILQHFSTFQIHFKLFSMMKTWSKYKIAFKTKFNHYHSLNHSEVKTDYIGGGKACILSFENLKTYALNNTNRKFSKYRYKSYVSKVIPCLWREKI
jgi:hypothetical protein